MQKTLEIFGTYYSYLGFFSVLLLIYLAFSSFGKLRPQGDKPQFSRFTWLAMLYSTGMGAGLLLRAVQEPVYYYVHPPRGLATPVEALKYTFYHWGITAWSFYVLVGLFFFYFSPPLARHEASQLKKRRSRFFIWTLRKIFIFSTLLGVVASVCLGSQQLLEGAKFVTQIPLQSSYVLSIILIIVGLSAGSAWSGITSGIKIFSRINIGLALLLMLFVFAFSTSAQFFPLFIESLARYAFDFIPMSLNLGSHHVSADFLKNWTHYYWAYWISWAPFTGLFLAKVSKGRSLREFILFSLLVPSLGTFLWFAIFANEAQALIASQQLNIQDLESIYNSLFIFIGQFADFKAVHFLILINLATFLITSVDSSLIVAAELFSAPHKKEKTILVSAFLIFFLSTGITIWGGEQLLQLITDILIITAAPLSLLMGVMFVKLLFWKTDRQT